MKAKIKTIDITAKEWFDKVNGNSYFSAQITVNYGLKSAKTIKTPFQYGYGTAYVDHALAQLKNLDLITSTRTEELRDEGIILRTNKQENCKKRDVVAFGL